MVGIQTNIVPRLFELWYHLGYGFICISRELLIFVIFTLFCLFPTNLHIFQSSFFFPKTLSFTTKIFCFLDFFLQKKIGGKIAFKKNWKFIFPNCFWFFILTKGWFGEYNVKIFTKIVFGTFRPFPTITKGVKWKLPFWQHFCGKKE